MLSALALARAIENGELTPAQVVDRCAEAIAKREADVGAFAALDIDGARKAAPGLKDTPLRGLPVGLKDIFDTADMPTEYGSQIYPGYRPRYDASMVAMIRRAGGTLDRQDRHHRVRPSRSGQDQEPAQPRAHAGRLVVGFGGGCRRGLLSDRDRHARPAAR